MSHAQAGNPQAAQGRHTPRFLIIWLVLLFAGLFVGSTISANNTQPDWYVPTATFTFTPSNTPTCVPTATPVTGAGPYEKRLNAGGAVYTDTLGNLWEADVLYAVCAAPYGYTAGEASSVTNPIGGTADQTIYRSQRYGLSFGYRFLVPNGNYELTLGFAETYFRTAGARSFNVLVNGTPRISNLDVVVAAGGAFIAYTRTLTVTISNGVLAIDFTSNTGGAMVSALYVRQILPPTPTPTSTLTPTETATPTRTNTPTQTATVTHTATPSPTPSHTPTRTLTGTATQTAPPTGTPTFSPTATPIRTNTMTPTATSTPPPLDPYEPNNTYGEATRLSPGSSYAGYIQDADDADYFYLDVPSGQTYVLASLSGLPADYDLFLDDNNGVRLTACTQRGLNDEKMSYKVLQAGRYYLRVVGFDHAWSRSGAYYLSVNLAPPASTPTSGDQYEPNNTMAQAYLLPGAGSYVATIDSTTDIDYYALQVPVQNYTLTVRLTNLPADYDLFLFQGEDPLAMPVAWSQRRGLVDEEVTWRPGIGRYEILIMGYDRNWSTDPYTLTVTLALAMPTTTVTPTPSRTATATLTRTPSVTLSPTVTRTPGAPGTSTATPTPIETPTVTETPQTGTPHSLWLPIIILRR